MSVSILEGNRPQPYSSIWSRLQSHISSTPRHAAVVQMLEGNDHIQTTFTYEDLINAATRVARNWTSRGVQAGETIAVLVHNGFEQLVLMCAASKIGAIFMPLNLNLLSESQELQRVLGISQPSVVVVEDSEYAMKLNELALTNGSILPLEKGRLFYVRHIDHQQTPAGWENYPQAFQNLFSDETLPDIVDANSPSQPALLILTSGSTGTAKLCIHTYGNIINAAEGFIERRRIGRNADTRLLQHLPPFHVFGMTYSLAFLLAGKTIVFPRSQTFEPGCSIEALLDAQCTHIAAVPSMIHAMVDHPDLPKEGLTSLESVDIAGANTPARLLDACRNRLQARAVSSSFGLSEACGVLAHDNDGLAQTHKQGKIDTSVGRPSPGTKIKICMPNSQSAVQRGTEGELHVNGGNVFHKYLAGEREETYFDEDGKWLITGDQAVMREDGCTEITGRYKDMIICGGENISPVKIENCINECSEVVDSQVLAVEDEIAGEIPLAIIRTTAPNDADVAATTDKVRQHITNSMGQKVCPKRVFDLQETFNLKAWPKTPSGKIDKVALRQMAASHLTQSAQSKSEEGNDAENILTKQGLSQLWADVSGVSPEAIDDETTIGSILDSLDVLRLRNHIQNRHGFKVEAEDMSSDTTLQQQSSLLNERALSTQGKQWEKPLIPSTPPTANDVLFNGNSHLFEKFKKAATETVADVGLSWGDIEHICPVGDNYGRGLINPYFRSANRRQTRSVPSSSVQQVEKSWKACLARHALLRSMAVKTEDHGYVLLVMKPTEDWFKLTMRVAPDVEDPEHLDDIDNGEWESTNVPGPLFKVALAGVQSTKGSGLVYHGNHGVFDAMSIAILDQDLSLAVGSESAPLPYRQDFKAYADALYLSRNHPSTLEDCKFHANRIRGISSDRKSLWPPLVEDSGADWVNQTPDSQQSLQSTGSRIRMKSHIPGLPQVIASRGISPPMLCKAACILFNHSQTGQRHVIFMQLEAGRTWPHFDGLTSNDTLPDPLDIVGPTFESTINRSVVDLEMTTGEWLKSLQNEQASLSAATHAPRTMVQEILEAEGESGVADVKMCDDVFRTQRLSWLPAANTPSDSKVVEIERHDYGPTGVRWEFSRPDESTIHLTLTHNGVKLTVPELERGVNEVLDIIARLCDQTRWDEKVAKILQA